ncbi:MAG: tetratricopeptide repeat protein [Gemmatimonadota bacterium]
MAKSVEQVLEEALELGDEGRWDDMARRLADALGRAPDDPYLLCWLGVAEQELGNEGSAYDHFRRCLDQDPLDPHLLAVAGAGLAAFDDPDAETALRAAALSGPDLPITRLQYGAYLAREGVFDEALEHLEAAAELDAGDPTIRGELGVALALQGDLEAAAEAMEMAVDLAPDDSWTRALLGLIYLEAGREEEAAEALVQAAGERDDDVETNVVAALAAAALGWDEAAHTALARAEIGASPTEARLVQEAEERILDGAEAARRMLRDALAPSILRERLAEPL